MGQSAGSSSIMNAVQREQRDLKCDTDQLPVALRPMPTALGTGGQSFVRRVKVYNLKTNQDNLLGKNYQAISNSSKRLS